MTTSTRACDALGCTFIATLTPRAGVLDRFDTVWSDGSSEVLGGLPPDGTIRCRPHRPGSRHSRTCQHLYRHSSCEAAFTCEGHGEGTGGVEAWGIHVQVDGK
jgi:hypothetical protein